ncbi:CAP domain-containing protein [Flaviflagellibacter deserti]|uniref:CAP domain-containing protein n=1 Tax=Flaviflagellibacter deserti TaxID=2267266 RepID=A0ABV9YY95_9HYPH
MKFLSSAFALLSCAMVTGGLLAACSTSSYVPDQKPTFYRNLSAPGSEVDGVAAASMISGYRANKGLGPVVLDPTLNKLAKQHAVAMARKTKVGHDVGDGPLDKRARAEGYAYARIAENVAGGYQTLAEAFSGWRDSPDHNKNMLMPKATRIGIGVAQAPGFKYKVFWSMVVAEPDTSPTPVMAGPPIIGLMQ